MLKNEFNKADYIIGLTISKYDLSLLTYVRFLAKYYGFSNKTLLRKDKFLFKNKINKCLITGPVLLFFTSSGNLEFINKLNDLKEITVLFFCLKDRIILNHYLPNTDHLVNSLTNVCVSLNVFGFNINTQRIYYTLIYLIDAYSKSISK